MLEEQLDQMLLNRKARETGLCPIRRELYSQCFDEVIRQTGSNCAERGLLLKRIHDEMKMTIAALEKLYESSMGYSMRKAQQAEKVKSEMEAKIVELQKSKVKEMVESSVQFKVRMGITIEPLE
ncbi:axonemal dynein light intermediate polypeptide 1 [Amia ocellicauda]|uniref:axonemal dynein light intermediate polypeptide 1 n=1 Tax=Amia ocellicauda TaxID=2972642 RepID=UPI003463F638